MFLNQNVHSVRFQLLKIDITVICYYSCIKQSHNVDFLKLMTRNTRMHVAPVFYTYEPNNERARNNIIFYIEVLWNGIPKMLKSRI